MGSTAQQSVIDSLSLLYNKWQQSKIVGANAVQIFVFLRGNSSSLVFLYKIEGKVAKRDG